MYSHRHFINQFSCQPEGKCSEELLNQSFHVVSFFWASYLQLVVTSHWFGQPSLLGLNLRGEPIYLWKLNICGKILNFLAVELAGV